MYKKVIYSIKRKKVPFLLGFLLLVGCIVAFLIIFNSTRSFNPVTLPAEVYGKSKVTDISPEEYKKMLKERQSFVLMVDNPGCVTTAKMRLMMQSLPEKMLFSYYRIQWPDTKDTNVRDYIHYFPSLMVIDKGDIVAYLSADKDEDSDYYNDADALQTWLEKYIKF